MTTEKRDREMVKEAKGILAGIVSHQKNNSDKMSQFEKQVDELKRAQRLMEESVYRAAPEVGNDDSGLGEFVKKDGSIRWTKEQGYVDTPNGRQPIENKGILDSEAPCSEWHRELMELNTQRNMARMLMSEPFTPKMDAKLQKHLNRAPRAVKAGVEKAMYDSASVGGDWVPDQFRAELFEQYKVPRVVRSLFSEIQMDRQTLLVPRLDRGGRPYIKGNITSDSPANYTGSTPATSQKTISTSGLACRYVIDDALAEDSAIALVPTLQRQIVSDLASAVEDALINGDAAATHQDDIANWNIRSRWGATGLGGSADHRRAWTGLRAQAFDRGTPSAMATPTYADILGLMGSLGEFNSAERVMITSPECVVANLLALTQVQTLDVFGPAATILTGQIASIAGIPVVISRFMGADLAASGLFTNSGSTTGLLIVSRDSYNIFSRRGVTVEQDKNITAGAINLVCTERLTFNTLDADATVNVVYGINVPSV
tara:strand:- start:2099 stop:3559 length:1461 start_codon:yes stop_codon:yes gene_type:complete